ncbi:MAG: dTDP-4-dehydrorhamnose reductase [Spirochaetales bacterium]|nr:dTDP-4-dehydrorhamnose reductase [Spirochaetales bacterium]
MIWVIGAQGMLGKELCSQLSAADLPYLGTDIELDILDEAKLAEFADRSGNIRTIVNCSAYTAVDDAEANTELAFAINADGVGNIARLAKQIGARLIHISTDYVFPGNIDRPLTEDDACAPATVYGQSKLKGEELAQAECAELIIIRTAWLYGLHGKNFVFTMLRLMKERKELQVVNDQYGSPTNAKELASAIITIVKSETFIPGIYHYSGTGRTSWYHFAEEIYKLGCGLGLLTTECRISPIGTDKYMTKAKRPEYSLLSTEKIERIYDIVPRVWKESLEEFLTTVKVRGR